MRRSSVSSVVLIVSFLFALSASAQDAPQNVTITGTVRDQSRSPVAGARITAVAADRSRTVTARTDQDGHFTIVVDGRAYTLTVAADGFATLSETVNAANAPAPREFLVQVEGVRETVNVNAGSAYASGATRMPAPVRDIPQSVTIVTKDAIKDQLMMSIGEVVRYVPGITAHQGENNRDDVIIRGNRSSADFFLNGIRDDVQYYRDLYNLDRVETMKGPNAMIFGRGGGGGVINRVTKEADFGALREISLQGGSFSHKRVSADFDQPINDKFAFRANGLYENSGSFRKFVGLERYGINPTLTILPGNQTRITFGY